MTPVLPPFYILMNFLSTISRRAYSSLKHINTQSRCLTANSSPPSHTIDDVNKMFGEARLCLEEYVASLTIFPILLY